MLTYKTRAEDFIVEELITPLTNSGKILYVKVKKKYVTTEELINHITKKTGLSSHQIGIAGLKDKVGITYQRITVYRNNIRSLDNFFGIIREKGEIIEYGFSEHALKIGKNIGNKFTLTLRSDSSLDRSKIEEVCGRISTGVPNYYGNQRFGNSGKNHIFGKKILFLQSENTFENKFRVQAFVSKIFNDYIDKKIEIGKLDGDMYQYAYSHSSQFLTYDPRSKEHAHQPFWWPKNGTPTTTTGMLTGPLVGRNLCVPPNGTASFKCEIEHIKSYGITPAQFTLFQHFGLYGIRRNIFLIPHDFSYRISDPKTLHVEFWLEPGGYATTIIDYINNQLGYE